MTTPFPKLKSDDLIFLKKVVSALVCTDTASKAYHQLSSSTNGTTPLDCVHGGHMRAMESFRPPGAQSIGGLTFVKTQS